MLDKPTTITVKEPGTEFHTLGEIFIAGAGDGNADGDIWQGRIWPCGTYSFIAVIGARRTVHRYANSRELALKILSKNQK